MMDTAPELKIQRADAGHIDVLAPLFDAYRVFYEQPPDIDAARRFVSQQLTMGTSVFYVAHAGERAAGFVRLYPAWSSIAVRPAWILEDLYVDPDLRGSGIARGLMRASQEHARASGAGEMSLETAAGNLPAQSLYESMGYVRERAFYKYKIAL
jgi:ribosomal protein S18 acetylase RimI-like enzyme